MSGWSSEALRRSKERQKLKAEETAIALQDKSVIDTHATAQGSALRKVIGDKCQEFNAEPGCMNSLSMVESEGVLKVSCPDGPGIVKLVFLKALNHIRCVGENGARIEGEYDFELTKDHLSAYLVDRTAMSVNLEDIANDVIEAVLIANGR